MKKFIQKATITGAALLLTACVSAENQQNDGITLKNCAIQETIPGAKATGAFLTINKSDDSQLSLVSAKAPSVTSHVEIHEMVMKNGTMKMQQIKSYPLKKGHNVFKKGGFHIMLMDMQKPLKVGEKHELTLLFSDGSSKQCTASVKSVKELTPKGMKMNHGKMMNHKMQHTSMKEGKMMQDKMKHDMKKEMKKAMQDGM